MLHYLDVSATRCVFDVSCRSDFGFRLVLKVKFAAFDLLVTATRFVGCVVHRPNFGLGIPLQFYRFNLRRREMMQNR